MNITVGKITRDPLNPNHQFRIDRTTILGNPFYLSRESDVDERDYNLKVYRIYLNQMIRHRRDPRILISDLAIEFGLTTVKSWERPTLEEFLTELDRLVELASIQPIELMCFCHPKRCHGNVLKSAIEWKCQQQSGNQTRKDESSFNPTLLSR
jgi:hypothetical protein